MSPCSMKWTKALPSSKSPAPHPVRPTSLATKASPPTGICASPVKDPACSTANALSPRRSPSDPESRIVHPLTYSTQPPPLRQPAEPCICPSLSILHLHNVPRPLRHVRRAPVPALVIRQVDVARLAQYRPRSLPLKLRILLTVRPSSGIVTSRHELR